MLRFFLAHRQIVTEVVALAMWTAAPLALAPRIIGWWSLVRRGIGRLAVRRGLAVLVVGCLALGVSAALSLLGYIPTPRVHDEHSYLLAADTFASGRLSNPPHPLWEHFESFHIIHQPTYASKYPPAQGSMLALGQVIGGHPIVGVWISIGLAYAATCWMMLAWLPGWIAVLGTSLAALHPAILVQWGWSYWGGAVAMMGGALVFGALRRIVRRPQWRHAVLLGVGLAVLANSRPFEGLVASLPVAVVLLGWMLSKRHPSPRVPIGHIGLPILGVLVLTGAAMGFYNARVTGHPLQPPYLVHEWTYTVSPAFLWQFPRPEPIYRHKVIRDFHLGWELAPYFEQRSISGFLDAITYKGRRLWRFYQGRRPIHVPLTIPLILMLWIWRDRWMRFALLTCGVVMIGLLSETWVLPHYAAPVASLVLVIVLQGVRHVYVWRWRGKRLGQSLVWALVVVTLVSFVGPLIKQIRTHPAGWSVERARLMAQLRDRAGEHLVIVRYSPLHSPHHEWVYNEADIDGARIVWARDLGVIENQRLLDYFKGRQAWLVEVAQDGFPAKLLPYTGAAKASTPRP